jgi:hypothetical protein
MALRSEGSHSGSGFGVCGYLMRARHLIHKCAILVCDFPQRSLHALSK